MELIKNYKIPTGFVCDNYPIPSGKKIKEGEYYLFQQACPRLPSTVFGKVIYGRRLGVYLEHAFSLGRFHQFCDPFSLGKFTVYYGVNLHFEYVENQYLSEIFIDREHILSTYKMQTYSHLYRQ